MALKPYIVGQDATHQFISHLPIGVQAAGYFTGSLDIRWTATDFTNHDKPYPAIAIDQSPNGDRPDADIWDVESGAGTVAGVADWITRARKNYANHVRPEQRWPGIYLSMNNLDPAVKVLEKAGIQNVGFWTAQPGLGLPAAINRVQTATGPYPCIGVQYTFGAFTDLDVWSLDWVKTMTGVATGVQDQWRWCHKCQSLCYGPNAAQSVCAAGGHHDTTGSLNYSLAWNRKLLVH